MLNGECATWAPDHEPSTRTSTQRNGVWVSAVQLRCAHGSEKLALNSGFRCPRTASNLASAASTAVIALQTAQYNLADGSVEAIKPVWSAPMFQLSFRV